MNEKTGTSHHDGNGDGDDQNTHGVPDENAEADTASGGSPE